jgi:2-C-methyl-D-erythritol 4-phosphate cytidylyltransferase
LGGRAILARTLEVFEHCPAVDEVWVVVAAGQRDYCQRALIDRYGLGKVRGLVAGGAERQESVWCGLQQIASTVDLVVVHDGVRPFVTVPLICQTLQKAAQYGAAITAVPVTDTLKCVSEAGRVEHTLSRERLWRTQTPQAFRRDLLQEAFQHAWKQGIVATDEASLVEALGHPVYVVRGAASNMKITTPDDLRLGESLLRSFD